MSKQTTDRVDGIFRQSLAAIELSRKQLAEPISRAGALMARTLDNGGKILLCGNGGSASDTLHFSSELLNRFERERRPLPAISLATDCATLTSVANDYRYEQVFSRQIEALGQPGDILLAITTSGHSPNILQAVATAHRSTLSCVVLNGRDGGVLARKLKEQDVEIRVPGNSTARIQEVHAIIIHCLCDLIDFQLFETKWKQGDDA